MIVGGIIVFLSVFATIVRDINKVLVELCESEDSQLVILDLESKICFDKYNFQNDADKLEKTLWEN